MIHSEARWGTLGGFQGGDVTSPQGNRIVSMDEGYKFILGDGHPDSGTGFGRRPLGVRPRGLGKLQDVNTFRTVPRALRSFQVRIKDKEPKRTQGLGWRVSSGAHQSSYSRSGLRTRPFAWSIAQHRSPPREHCHSRLFAPLGPSGGYPSHDTESVAIRGSSELLTNPISPLLPANTEPHGLAGRSRRGSS